MKFPEENLLAAAAQTDSFFITKPGALLKADRYKIIRKLGRGRFSNMFLVEDLQSTDLSFKYLAAKMLSIDSTFVLRHGVIHELNFLQAVVEYSHGWQEPFLPILHDHFAQRGPHGVHYCLITRPHRSDVNGFHASAPTGRLAVHIVKPIIANVVDALKVLHACHIIHANVKADNVLFVGPDTAEIEEAIANEPPRIEGSFEFEGKEYPILRSQPFEPKISWDASPFIAETIMVLLSDLGAGTSSSRPKPPGDIGAFALRAPENIICAEIGKEIDVWALGCMAYELLAGEVLFRPQPIKGLTADESLLLLQITLTGETLDKTLVEQSQAKEQYFDAEGGRAVLIFFTPDDAQMRHGSRQLRETQDARHWIDAAAGFIQDCLRLNPSDRPTADQLELHRWLETAFMGGDDEERPVSTVPIPPLPQPTL
ncbi:kinase-like protein [Fistulina hepatica ATCC 64428]|uniref:non-specific serine/threonine protein kinase n=1 Tax=Fistulina hepatica ATCC 64428 TaxID=1128425 RepID=A0A0D7ADB2_9AGAR|nr:kinase-like protein [Fistulina hepatica ATCC 64428]